MAAAAAAPAAAAAGAGAWGGVGRGGARCAGIRGGRRGACAAGSVKGGECKGYGSLLLLLFSVAFPAAT